jgi:hypothetical protein
MYALIKREIRDHIVYFIAALLFSAVLVGLLSVSAYHFDERESGVYYGLAIPYLVALVLAFSAMGVSQMYTDRARKVSAFLSVLPVTRDRILTARIVAGILAILLALLPATIAALVLSHLLLPPIPIFGSIISDVATTTFLLLFACYCLGLLTGWTAGKIAPTFGALGLTLILFSLIVVKGCGPDIRIILVLIIAASLLRTWHKFVSTPL